MIPIRFYNVITNHIVYTDIIEFPGYKMISDTTYQTNKYQGSFIEHKYDSKVNILDNPFAQSLLAKLCQKQTVLPEVNNIVKSLYQVLMMEVFNTSLGKSEYDITTRMSEFSDKGSFKAKLIDQKSKVISVDLYGV